MLITAVNPLTVFTLYWGAVRKMPYLEAYMPTTAVNPIQQCAKCFVMKLISLLQLSTLYSIYCIGEAVFQMLYLEGYMLLVAAKFVL